MDLSGVYFLIFFQSDSSAILFKKSENLPSKMLCYSFQKIRKSPLENLS